MYEMQDKVALIVGGSGGIGRASALAFARSGANVVLAGRDPDRAAAVLELLAEERVQSMFVQADVCRLEDMEKLVERTVADFGRLDYAFNNAGWEGTAALLADVSEADWLKMMDIKLNGLWRGMKYQIRQMCEQGGGAIVNMAGNWGLTGFSRYGSYSAAAHGVMGLTKTAALEYGRDNIRVNAVCPGAVDAPLLDRMLEGNEQAKQAFGSQLALGRIASAEEVAEAVLWLCSEKASYVSGDRIVLNGGGS